MSKLNDAIESARDALQDYETAMLAMSDALSELAEAVDVLPDSETLTATIENDLDPDQAPLNTIANFLDELQSGVEDD